MTTGGALPLQLYKLASGTHDLNHDSLATTRIDARSMPRHKVEANGTRDLKHHDSLTKSQEKRR